MPTIGRAYRARQRALSEPARLPALHRGTRQAGRIQHWLSSRTAFPGTARAGVLPAAATSPIQRSRPGADCKSARGGPLSLRCQECPHDGAFTERDGKWRLYLNVTQRCKRTSPVNDLRHTAMEAPEVERAAAKADADGGAVTDLEFVGLDDSALLEAYAELRTLLASPECPEWVVSTCLRLSECQTELFCTVPHGYRTGD